MPHQISSPIRHGRVKLPMGVLYWREWGRGETVLFLHGSWQDGSQWLPGFFQLGRDFHCLAPDLLGFGESRSESNVCSVTLEVESLAAFLHSLRISRCYIIAHSLGAWVAARYALQYPEQVKALVLIEPEGLMPNSLKGRWRWHRLLSGRMTVGTWVLRLIQPFVKRNNPWLQQKLLLRRQLKQYPAACRLLFQRRAAEIQAEGLHADLKQLQPRILLLPPTSTHEETRALVAAFKEACPQANTLSQQGKAGSVPLDVEDYLADICQFFQQTSTEMSLK